MTRLFHRLLLLVSAAAFALAGCRAPEPAVPPALGFVEVRDAARRQLTAVRTREILRRMAARLADAEEHRAELTGLIDSFPAGSSCSYDGDAGRDPRYRYGVEAVAYARLMLLRPPAIPAEEFMEPVARAEIDFEVLEKLCRLDRRRNGGDAAARMSSEARDLELELRIAAGLSEEALRNFDYSTLPPAGRTPPSPAAAEAPVGAEPLRVARRLFDLPGAVAAAPASVPAGEPERLIAQEFALLRRLAEAAARYAADPKNFATPADALLARRLAAGRMAQLDALEQAFRDR